MDKPNKLEVRRAQDANDDPGLQDGEVICIGAEILPAGNKEQPLFVRYELEVAAGIRGKAIAERQVAAVRAVLAYMSENERQSAADGTGIPGLDRRGRS